MVNATNLWIASVYGSSSSIVAYTSQVSSITDANNIILVVMILAWEYCGSKYVPIIQKQHSTTLSLMNGSFTPKSHFFHHLMTKKKQIKYVVIRFQGLGEEKESNPTCTYQCYQTILIAS